MNEQPTNYLRFEGDEINGCGATGLISTLDADIDLVARPLASDNVKAPTHRLYGRSPRGHLIEIGGIWEKTSKYEKTYYTLSIPRLKFNANLGRFPGQDDTSLQAIIEWGEAST